MFNMREFKTLNLIILSNALNIKKLKALHSIISIRYLQSFFAVICKYMRRGGSPSAPGYMQFPLALAYNTLLPQRYWV